MHKLSEEELLDTFDSRTGMKVAFICFVVLVISVMSVWITMMPIEEEEIGVVLSATDLSTDETVEWTTDDYLQEVALDKKQIVYQMLDSFIISQKFDEIGGSISNADVDNRIDEIMDELRVVHETPDLTLKEYMAQEYLTEDVVRKNVEYGIKLDAVVVHLIETTPISNEDITERFDAFSDQYTSYDIEFIAIPPETAVDIFDVEEVVGDIKIERGFDLTKPNHSINLESVLESPLLNGAEVEIVKESFVNNYYFGDIPLSELKSNNVHRFESGYIIVVSVTEIYDTLEDAKDLIVEELKTEQQITILENWLETRREEIQFTVY